MKTRSFPGSSLCISSIAALLLLVIVSASVYARNQSQAGALLEKAENAYATGDWLRAALSSLQYVDLYPDSSQTGRAEALLTESVKNLEQVVASLETTRQALVSCQSRGNTKIQVPGSLIYEAPRMKAGTGGSIMPGSVSFQTPGVKGTIIPFIDGAAVNGTFFVREIDGTFLPPDVMNLANDMLKTNTYEIPMQFRLDDFQWVAPSVCASGEMLPAEAAVSLPTFNFTPAQFDPINVEIEILNSISD